MKRTLAILAVGLIGASAMAQSLNIVCGNVTYIVPASQAGDMTYTGDSLLTVMGRALPVGEISHMYVDGSVPADNTVTVAYDGKSAAITVAGNIMRFVSFSGDGAAVTVTQSSALSATEGGEITYRLSGNSAEGSFALDGSYKSTIALDGLTLTSAAGPAIDIQNGKRIKLIVGDGCSSSLCDAAGGSHKAALYCKGHLEISGTGTLDVKGLTAHAIAAKEYITLEGATVRVTAAVKDGINCNQSFTLNSGSIDISGTGDDGLQTSFKDDTDRQSDDTGTITINGGTVKCAVTATAAKGLKADGDVIVKGGEISVTTSGGGKWDSTDVKTKASTCISADGNVNIDGGKLTLTSSGSGGKAISCDLDLNISDGTIAATTTGGLFAYVNGTEYSDYTGNTDRIDSDYKSSPKAIKADGNVNISGGNITVSTKGNGAEGIESKAVMTISGGTISAYTRDDALNSSSHMYIKDGDITCVATGNDAIDSNGNLYISGGTIRAFGASAPECGIDANEEEGYTVILTGGTILAVGGGNNSTPTTSESTQPFVSGNASMTAGSTVTLKDGSTVLATFTVPENYSSSSSSQGGRPGGGPGGGPGGMGGQGGVLVSCPGLKSGSTYTLTAGSSSSSLTAKLTGSSFRP